MSWHGTGVFHVKTEQEKEKEEELIPNGLEFHGKARRSSKTTEESKKGDIGVFFIDSISKNSSLQNTVMVLNILESVFHRINMQLPACKFISLVTDNANCYRNNTFPILAYYICHEHGMNLRVVLHPDSQDGKYLVHAHFAVAVGYKRKGVMSE